MTLIGFGPNMPQAPFVAVPREEAKKTREKLDSLGLLDNQLKPREKMIAFYFHFMKEIERLGLSAPSPESIHMYG